MYPYPSWEQMKQNAFSFLYPSFMDTKGLFQEGPVPPVKSGPGGPLKLSFGERKALASFDMDVDSLETVNVDAEAEAIIDALPLRVAIPIVAAIKQRNVWIDKQKHTMQQLKAQQAKLAWKIKSGKFDQLVELEKPFLKKGQASKLDWNAPNFGLVQVPFKSPLEVARSFNKQQKMEDLRTKDPLRFEAEQQHALKLALIAGKKMVAQEKRRILEFNRAQEKKKQVVILARKKRDMAWQSKNEINRQQRCQKDFCGCKKPDWYSMAVLPCNTKNVSVYKKASPSRYAEHSQYSQEHQNDDSD